MMDKNMRRTNVVFSGIRFANSTAAKSKINNICNNTLKVNVNIVRTTVLKTNQQCLVEFETKQQAIDVLSKGFKLKNTNMYVHRDYTSNERDKLYQLRKLKNELKQVDTSLKFKFKYTTLLVNERHVDWSNGGVVTRNDDDKAFLVSKLSKL